jgi:hypothetical protein
MDEISSNHEPSKNAVVGGQRVNWATAIVAFAVSCTLAWTCLLFWATLSVVQVVLL